MKLWNWLKNKFYKEIFIEIPFHLNKYDIPVLIRVECKTGEIFCVFDKSENYSDADIKLEVENIIKSYIQEIENEG